MLQPIIDNSFWHNFDSSGISNNYWSCPSTWYLPSMWSWRLGKL